MCLFLDASNQFFANFMYPLMHSCFPFLLQLCAYSRFDDENETMYCTRCEDRTKQVEECRYEEYCENKDCTHCPHPCCENVCHQQCQRDFMIFNQILEEKGRIEKPLCPDHVMAGYKVKHGRKLSPNMVSCKY